MNPQLYLPIVMIRHGMKKIIKNGSKSSMSLYQKLVCRNYSSRAHVTIFKNSRNSMIKTKKSYSVINNNDNNNNFKYNLQLTRLHCSIPTAISTTLSSSGTMSNNKTNSFSKIIPKTKNNEKQTDNNFSNLKSSNSKIIRMTSNSRRHYSHRGYISDPELPIRSTVVFSMTDIPGALDSALRLFADYSINLTRIESRYDNTHHNRILFYCDTDISPTDAHLHSFICTLNSQHKDIIHSCILLDPQKSKKVPWFPITMSEVDSLALLILEGGTDLKSDHPGFNDKLYKNRRMEIANYATKFKYGDKPMKIKYTNDEINCWNIIYNKLTPLLYKYACPQYLDAFNKLKTECGYNENNLPQLADVSDFLYQSTKFRLRPTSGLISSRHFLNGLAFRTFFCTQYIRHHSVPFYTPEPDIVHELVGHAPLFSNPEFADFSQQIGLASIGASDEQIIELARCYWFSIEFGLCRSYPGAHDKKIYGAGILSSFGEIEYSMSDEPEIREWNPFEASKQDFPITKYQPMYYIAESFEDAKDKLGEFAQSLDKPFSVTWDDKREKLIVDRNIERDERNYQDYGTYVGDDEK